MTDLEDLEKRIQRIENKLGLVNQNPYVFEDLIENLDQRTLEIVWQGMDTREITLPLIGINREQLLRVKGTLSRTRWNEINKELSAPFMLETTASTIRLYREKFLDRVYLLESRGEIVISRGANRPFLSFEKAFNKPQEPPFDVKAWLQSIFEKA